MAVRVVLMQTSTVALCLSHLRHVHPKHLSLEHAKKFVQALPTRTWIHYCIVSIRLDNLVREDIEVHKVK